MPEIGTISFENNMHSIFRIDAFCPAATVSEIDALRAVAAVAPPLDYLTFVSEMTDVELLVNGRKYLRIWGPSRCIEMNYAYRIQEYIPRSLAIGDDEGGMALVLMEGDAGNGLYMASFANLDANDATFVAPTLGDLLTKGIGWGLF